MDGARFGSDVRLLRRHRRWTQRRLAREARVSRRCVSEIECGRAGRLPADDLSRVVNAVGGYLSVRIVYQGEGLDRLRDERHAALVDEMVERLRRARWEVATEVSFNVYGERGSIDILAFHPATGILLVVEVKSVIPDVGGMLMTLDRKVRLAADLARNRGWDVRSVSRLLVVRDASTARRRVDEHAATFANALPVRNVAVNAFLRAPAGTISGLLFLSSARTSSQRRIRTADPATPHVRARTPTP